MSGALPPLPQYAFMAWCSVKKKHRDNYNKWRDKVNTIIIEHRWFLMPKWYIGCNDRNVKECILLGVL
jgi:hypothetical protein